MHRKKVILLAAAVAVIGQSAAWAQERPPLAMRIEFEWTVIGVLAGVAVGTLIWLTDPATINLADSIAGGTAWGAIAGAGFGIFVMQRSAIFPEGTVQVRNPLAPENRISSDPVADESREHKLTSTGLAFNRSNRELSVSFLNIRF